MTNVYSIPADHAGGTFWYHAHFHGRNAFSVIGGAYGMVVIEDQPGVGTGLTGAPLDPAVKYFLNSRMLERDLVAFSEFGTYLGNGDPLGAAISLTANQWARLRTVFVKPEMIWGQAIFKDPAGLVLAWNTTTGPRCEIYDIAQDGVYFSTVPWKPYAPNGETSTYAFEVLGSSRLDLAIRCLTAGTFTLQFDGGVVARFTVLPEPPVNFYSGAVASPFTSGGTAQWKPNRPAYLAELRQGFPGFPAYITTIMPSIPVDVSFAGFNGMYWDPLNPIYTVTYGRNILYEFVFTGTEAHPTHMHMQHFQIVEPGGCGSLREGEHYDSISVYGNASCTVRVQFMDFTGKQLLHCHVLDHEDMGIMTFFDVTPVQAAGSFEASAAFVPETLPTACCVPRLDPAGAQVCQFVPECGSNLGINTCNQPCSVRINACPPNKPFCSTIGVCYYSADAASAAGLPVDLTCTTPIYPYIIMAVSLAVGIIAVISAVVIVRRRSQFSESVFISQPAREELHMPAPSSSPFNDAL